MKDKCLISFTNRKTTTENTVFFTRFYPINLQVKKLSSMFVSQSNNPLENDEIRTLKQTLLKTENIFRSVSTLTYRFS